MKLIGIFFALCLVFSFTTNSAYATEIVAIVDNEVITDFDFEQKTKLVAALNKIPKKDLEGFSKASHDQIMNAVIEDLLKLEYAKRVNIKLTTKDTEEYLNDILIKNGLLPKDTMGFLRQHEITREFFQHYLKVETTWRKVLELAVVRTIKLENSEVANRLHTLSIPDNEENLLRMKSIIFQEKLEAAEKKLIQEIRKYSFVRVVGH